MFARPMGWAGLAACLCVASGLRADSKDVVVEPATKALYELDEKLKAAFEKKYPGRLPESQLKLPKATAKSFVWSRGVTGDVLTQGRSSTCWAFASVEAFECSWRIRNKRDVPMLAVQPILDHTGKKDGAPTRLGMETLVKNGTERFGLYPFTGQPGPQKLKVLKYRAVAHGHVGDGGNDVPPTEALKEAILRHGPLVVSLNVTPSFEKYRGGVYSSTEEAGDDKSHAALLVGWNDKLGAWRLKNSWNTNWGEGGYMWIKYGSNNVGRRARWVRAQSVYYNLPADAHKLLGDDAAPFYRWPNAQDVKLPEGK